MSSAADRVAASSASEAHKPSGVFVALAAILVLGGLYVFSYPLQALWSIWTTDALRSIGMLIPPVSLWLMWRAWRREDWQSGGNWWGLALLLVAMLLGLLVPHTVVGVLIPGTSGLRLNLLPSSLPIFLYISGAVILFGGAGTWRKAWFPICLLLFLQPVPGALQSLVDLPLQYIAAHAARGFAGLINVPVTDGLLEMMFAPDLGMYIAPGCNGLRSVVAMGYLALLVGYLYRMSWRNWGIYIVGAMALAYLFNFARLFGVVIYYWFALRFPAIGAYGVEVDYVIGGCLFLGMAVFLLGLARRWQGP